jgi:L-asparaginase II
MSSTPYLPIFELTRGRQVESIHYGALAVVDAHGRLVASFGDARAVTYLRSTAKPFQVLPFIQRGGHRHFDLTSREIALMCASHSGTDEHVQVVGAIQAKTGVQESDLMCGVHPPFHQPTAEALRRRDERPTPNRHNCSGKHTGMLACALMRELPRQDYINPGHPVQAEILQTFAEMCGIPEQQVAVGIDGCSAPNFAVPLYNAALGFARLCDPAAGDVQPEARAGACWTIVSAMIAHPDMVGGPDSFDTQLMNTTAGRILAKGGAEGFQGLGLLPGALGAGSPALGIAVKISDGDPSSRARHAVSLEVLRQLGALAATDLETMCNFGPTIPVYNWRKVLAGEGHPSFQLSGR